MTRCSPETSRSRNLPCRDTEADLEALQRGHRRVVGLQHAQGGQVDAGHDPPDRTLGEEGGERLHLGKLRHVSSVPHRASPDSAESCLARSGADVVRAPHTRHRRSDTVAQTTSREPARAETALGHAPRRLVAALLTALAAGPDGAGHRRGRPPARPRRPRSRTASPPSSTRLAPARGIPRLTTRGRLVEVAREQARRMAGQSRLYHNPRPHLGRQELALGRRERRLRPGRRLPCTWPS